MDLTHGFRIDPDRAEVIGEAVIALLVPSENRAVFAIDLLLDVDLVLDPRRLERDRQLAPRQEADGLAVEVHRDVLESGHARFELGGHV